MGEMIERVARAILTEKFGAGVKLMFAPIPDDFPNAEAARKKFEERIEEARRDARAAINVLKPPLNDARALLMAQADDLSMGSPVMEICDRIEAVIGPALISDVISLERAFDRAQP